MPESESPLIRLARLVLELGQLRRSPADMPYSKALLGVLVLASVLLDVVAGGLFGETRDVLGRSLVSTGLLLALCAVALAIRHLGHRYVQTASALIACGLLFSLLALPFAWLAGPTPPAPDQLTPLHVLMAWILLAIFVWSLAVNAHIMRQALEAPFALAFALVIAWAVADWSLGRALFDAAA